MSSQTPASVSGSVFHASVRERDAAQRIIDEYVREMGEHTETPELTPPPAFDDIVFAESQQTGIDDDTLYDYARELLVAQTGELIEE